MFELSHTAIAPSGSASAASEVIGRDWSSSSRSPASAHSMSCGAPACRSAARARSATAATWAGVSDGRSRSASDTGTSATPPPGASRWAIVLVAITWLAMWPSRPTVKVSPSCSPPTIVVPSPHVAPTTASERRPETGSALKATPATSASTMGWMSTAGATGVASSPRSRR